MNQQNNKVRDSNYMEFGEHLEVLRKILWRILGISTMLALGIFCLKDETFNLLFAPSESDFCTFRWIESFIKDFGFDFSFEKYNIKLIATTLSSQFMTHISTSFVLGLLLSSPYSLYEILKFITPALYENEKKYSTHIIVIIFVLFVLGILMSYFIIFPISVRFLGTYSVSDKVNCLITLDSYIETFTILTFIMGIIFQLPVLSFILAKLHLISYKFMRCYRKHALILIMFVAAIITPPDIMTLIVVTIPLYLLYEISIQIVKWVEQNYYLQ